MISCSHCGKVLHHDEFTEEPTFVKGTGGEAPRLTRENMGNCIRALCNSNVAGGFRVGKDASLLVTYIRTSQDTQKDLGGKPPSDRHVMAFFAGGMHGYVCPILLHYWENKEPDMKIFGPMPRDIECKTKYSFPT